MSNLFGSTDFVQSFVAQESSSSSGLPTIHSAANTELVSSQLQSSPAGLRGDAAGGQKQFDVSRGTLITLDNFGGIGQGTDPTDETLAELDTLIFSGAGLLPENLLLTQENDDLIISFNKIQDTQVRLTNFQLDKLDNLVNQGNIIFSNQNQPTDSFDVVNADRQLAQVFNSNSTTFLNDLKNSISGFDDANDVINGQADADDIAGLSGDDILRGNAGDDSLSGGTGIDSLQGGTGIDTLNGGPGADRFVIEAAGADWIDDFSLAEGS
jgi:hypothetical protein